MGSTAPKVRVVVGKHYGRNANGSCKPLRAMIQGQVISRILFYESVE